MCQRYVYLLHGEVLLEDCECYKNEASDMI
jgi:hypothetical protein